ncbi:MAG: amidophosphoribosyltransferase, partial [Propionibacteriaceae bacterium]
LDGLVAATEQPKDQLCRACFDGIYPIELPLAERLGKSILEDGAKQEASNAASRRGVDGLEAAVAGVGGGDALSRP